jgi:hypothetical protein
MHLNLIVESVLIYQMKLRKKNILPIKWRMLNIWIYFFVSNGLRSSIIFGSTFCGNLIFQNFNWNILLSREFSLSLASNIREKSTKLEMVMTWETNLLFSDQNLHLKIYSIHDNNSLKALTKASWLFDVWKWTDWTTSFDHNMRTTRKRQTTHIVCLQILSKHLFKLINSYVDCTATDIDAYLLHHQHHKDFMIFGTTSCF